MAKKQNRFGNIMKLLDNEYARVVSEGTIADVAGFIDTGSYSLNALVSGSIFGGIPGNKITALAGEEATGKTFFALGIAKHFLDNNENALVLIFETEGSVTKDIALERGLDGERVLSIPVDTVQSFKTQAIRVVDDYLSTPETDRVPYMFILDSLGMLSTSKEMADSQSGKEVKDMTRTAEIKAAFRVLTNKLSKAKIPFIVTNHVYQTMGMFPTKEMGGGGGLKYAANNIVALSKSKDKDSDGNLVGAIIRCKNLKSRLTREGTEAFVRLSHQTGLDRYYGLTEIAIDHGIFKKMSTKIEVADGSTVFEKAINKNPEKFFTKEVLEAIDAACKKEYCYGAPSPEEVVEDMLNGDE